MKPLKWMSLVLLVALLTHAAILLSTPYLMMTGLYYWIDREAGRGSVFIAERPEHGNDRIVRSSPDLLYSVCAFRLKDGPLHVRSPVGGNYMSVSFFGHDTNNFFTLNDKQVPDGFDILLVRRGTDVVLPEGVRLLESDSPYGVILFRYYLADSEVRELDALREAAICDRLVF